MEGGAMIRNILIPTDGSDYGKTAIAYGVYFARKLNAQLTGLHVVDMRLLRGPVFTDISGSIGLPPYQDFLPAIESGLNAKADAILQDFRGQCEAAGVHPETKKVTGVIDETIIKRDTSAATGSCWPSGENTSISTTGRSSAPRRNPSSGAPANRFSSHPNISVRSKAWPSPTMGAPRPTSR
jgi:nucleotide-binding universal stress UspA family protein